ncbi:LysE family translocator [Bosea sp. BK604]|uniref:LysE family translocator n=1 Tax=Bosea sp. BK604 TaxID=2512180 RepID=UPI001051BA72|nr:LysE family translocator [Bosea sp. BK604]TCR66969.1 threonine/homoserine/homoserine lactone efflux protein [Bosea sp. BK604]
MDGLLGFVLAGIALAGSPGPATLSLAATGAAFGAREGLVYATGITIGMAGVIAITASGMVGVLMAVPGVAPVVTIAAAGYFLYLAYRIATAPPLTDASERGARPSFAAGALLSLVNPKGYAAMAALFSGFVLLRGALASDALAKAGVLMAIIAAVNLLWLVTGAALTRFFREPRTNRIVNIVFAILLIASVAFALPH